MIAKVGINNTQSLKLKAIHGIKKCLHSLCIWYSHTQTTQKQNPFFPEN